jgi:hypothetical protein
MLAATTHHQILTVALLRAFDARARALGGGAQARTLLEVHPFAGIAARLTHVAGATLSFRLASTGATAVATQECALLFRLRNPLRIAAHDHVALALRGSRWTRRHRRSHWKCSGSSRHVCDGGTSCTARVRTRTRDRRSGRSCRLGRTTLSCCWWRRERADRQPIFRIRLNRDAHAVLTAVAERAGRQARAADTCRRFRYAGRTRRFGFRRAGRERKYRARKELDPDHVLLPPSSSARNQPRGRCGFAG